MKRLKRSLLNLLRPLTRWSAFTNSVKDGTSAPLTPGNLTTSPLSSLYTRCSELPLHNFIQIINTDKLEWLLKDQTGTLPDNAVEVWEGIFCEYMEKTNDSQYRYMIDLTYEIERLRVRMLAVEASLKVLAIQKSKPLIGALLELGYKVEDMKGWDAYFQSLENIKKRLGTVSFELRQKQKEFEDLRKSYGRAKTDEDYFTRALAMLSKYQGYRIDPLVTTVSEYAQILNTYIKDVDKWQHRKE